MRQWIKKWRGMIVTAVVALLLLTVLVTQLVVSTSGNERYFSGDAELYFQALVEAGFPEDYAVSLTELHLLHPNWEFEPLLITEQNSQYTWDYVIDRETEDGETNIIYTSNTYAAYHHPTNREVYDSGYYQASREAVEYFMDPRNFLNEADIFQFYALSGGEDADLDAVKAILAGTFMENAYLENGKTYAAYLTEIGEELDINPLFLAAKVRQEQGVTGTSPIISGKCGNKLWEFYDNQTEKTDSGKDVFPPSSGHTEEGLKELNGYYNYFNVGATGTGVFKIYYNAMIYAQKGTESMRDEWGSSAWNTRWKALYGGADFLKTRYIDAYQSTIYLQKFNVDSRSGTNFWKQYMQSVFGALTESRSLYQSFAALDTLDAPAHFLIPVYEGMPTSPCADPANGSIKNFAQATTKYTYQAELTSPQRVSGKNTALYLDHETYPNNTVSLEGVVTHDYAVNGLEYAWDGGEWHTASDGKNLNISLFVNFPENTSHILTVRGKASYDVTKNGTTQTIHTYFLYAVIYVNVIPPPSVHLSFEVGNTVTERTIFAGSSVTLPVCQASDFAGWCGSDGSFLPSGAELVVHSDVTFSAVFLEFQTLEGAALSFTEDEPCLRFSAVIDEDAYKKLTEGDDELIKLSAVLETDHTTAPPTEVTLTPTDAQNKRWVRLDAKTDALSPTDYDIPYRATFYAELYYSDGTSAVLNTSAPSSQRTAKQVALAALADALVQYPTATVSKLQSIVTQN